MNFFTKLTPILIVTAVQAKAIANSYYYFAYYSDSDCRNLLGSLVAVSPRMDVSVVATSAV
jgi:hypothetical protein